jgi:hypothetical protein
MRVVVLVALFGCSTTETTQQLGTELAPCTATLPAETAGWVGDARVTLTLSGTAFTTTFLHEGETSTSEGAIDYTGQGTLTMVTSSATGIDETCVGKTVYYSYAWSDDCTEVGLSRDRDDCELRIYNLDGSTMVQK